MSRMLTMLRLISLGHPALLLGSGGDLAAEIVDLHHGVGHGVEAAGDLPRGVGRRLATALGLLHGDHGLGDPWVSRDNMLPTSAVLFWVRAARARTSSATTAKPRPCSPARAASMAALSASRLVWAAMPPITPSTLPICWASSCISSTLAAADPPRR